jgi:hypothetical protein
MVDNDVLQETRPVRERPDAEIAGERLPEIRERRARTNVYSSHLEAGFRRPACQHHRHVLARVIRTRRRRIVAMVGSNDQQIPLAQ